MLLLIIELAVTLEVSFRAVVLLCIRHLHRRVVVLRVAVAIQIGVNLVGVDNDGLIGDVALVVRLLNPIFTLLPTLSLLRILALLLAPLDEYVAEKDEAASADHRADDDGALSATSHVIAAVTVAVSVAARSAA